MWREGHVGVQNNGKMSLKFCIIIIESYSQKTFFAIVLYTIMAAVTSRKNRELTPWTGRVTMIGMKIFILLFFRVGSVICPPSFPIKCTTKLKARILVFNIRIPITKGFTVSRNAHSYERTEFTALKCIACGHFLWFTWYNFPVLVRWLMRNEGTQDTPLSSSSSSSFICHCKLKELHYSWR